MLKKQVKAQLALFAILAVIFSLNPATAENETFQTKGYIYLTINNPVPELTSLEITSPVYPYSRISCMAEFTDNAPETVRLKYRWYADGILISEEESVSGIQAGKEVRCEATAYDSIGQPSNTLTANTTVQQLNVFGITAYAARNLEGGNLLTGAAIISLISLAIILARKKLNYSA